MSDNVWHGDIEIGIDAARAKHDIDDLEGRVKKLRKGFMESGASLDSFESKLDHLSGSVGRAAGGLKKLDQNVHIGASGLRELGAQAQAAERKIQKLYQTQAAGAISAGKVPQSMASWLPTSGVSQKDKDLALGGSIGTDSNVIAALKAERAELDKVQAQRQKNIAAIDREKAARSQLNAEARREAEYRRVADSQGPVAERRLREVDAINRENQARQALFKTNHQDKEASLQAQQSFTRASQARIQATNSLRSAEEQQGAAIVRSLNEQAKVRQRNQQALTTAQGRLQAEDEAQAYRKLEASVGRAEAAKRRLVAAQRAVNAAQEGMRAATGDIQAQIAATNRLADAKRRQAQAEVAARSAQGPQGNMDSTRYALYDVGATAGMAAAVGGLAVGATVKNFMELESQFATVSRTSAETGHNMSIMTGELLDMGSTIPLPLKGLTDMAARAAQLGVEGQADILAFTETMSKFAAISDTVTETEVAEYFGRLNNLTGNMKNWEEMADAVAKVGIDSAATDQQILKTSQEIAQAGAGANYSQKEIIGLAAAFASLAVPPERARSVLLDLNKIMTKGMGESTDSMKALSGQMGVSEEAIRGMWRAEPTKLISEMAKSLKDMEPEEVMTFLSDFGLKGARALPVFMAIAKDAKNAGEGLTILERAQQSVNESSGELDRQFGITMETLAAAWQTFLNSLQGAGFDAMADWGPILTDVLNGAGDLLDWVREFVGTDFGKFVGGTAIGLGALATALAGAAAMAAIFGASMLAIKSAAASGVFGAKAATTIGQFGNNAKLAGGGMMILGTNAGNAAPKLSTLGVNATKTDKAMAGLKRAGAGVAGVLGGPIGIALTAATAIGVLGANAVETARSYRELGAAITAVDAETGKSMSSDGILGAANANVLNNSQMKQWSVNLQNLLPGEDLAEIDTKSYTEYLKLVREGTEAQEAAQKAAKSANSGGAGKGVYGSNSGLGGGGGFGTKGVSGQDYAANSLGQVQADRFKEAGTEIGTSLSKLSSSDASVAFSELWKEADKAGVSMDELVTSLGGDFSDAFYEGGVAVGGISSALGSASSNTELGNYMLAEYGRTAQAAKDSITEMNPALEEMAEGFQGVFDGMAEGAQATGAMFSALLGGVQSADQLKNAMIELGIVNAETGELTGETVDLYDEVTGKWSLLTAEQQAAVGALSSYAQAQVAGIAGEYALTSAIQGSDVALTNAQATMDSSRAHFIEQAGLLGINAAEAGKMADALGLVEGQYLVVIDTSTLPAAKDQVQAVLDKVNEVPGAKSIAMTALTEEAKAELVALGFEVNLVEGEYVVTVTDQGTASATASELNAIDTTDETKTITVNTVYTSSRYNDDGSGRRRDDGPGGANGGFFGSGSRKPFWGGGFTGGGGGKHSIKGPVHANEYVFPARAVDASRGVPTLDALGRMVQQHYPQAMSPSVVVQGGGNGGPTELGSASLHALARLVSTQINLDGSMIAGNTNSHNRTSGRRGAN